MADLFEIHSESFRSIVCDGSELRRLGTDFKFTEGPIWMQAENCVLFSDIPASEIRRWSEVDGISSFRTPSGNANGNTVDLQGRLITCEHGNRRVTRTEPDGEITVLADSYNGKKLNSPNDAVVKSDGSIWFTDPTYGVAAELVEQPRNYVFRLDGAAGEPVAVVADFAMPNGLCFSPDESILYIADSSHRHHVRRFTVNDDNTLNGGDEFALIDPGVPDGMRVDTEGRLYCTAGDGVHVFAPDGEMLGKILVPECPANCTFGGADWKTLFITARTSLYAISLAVEGARPA